MRALLIFMTVMLIAARFEKSDLPPDGWTIGEPEMSIMVMPLFPEKELNDLVTLQFSAYGSEEPHFSENTGQCINKRTTVRIITPLSTARKTSDT
jgi:hypothetical protein